MADLGIQNAFLDGIEKVFSIMFTDRALFCPLDLENTSPDSLYQETSDKKYKEGIPLVAKITTTFEQGQNYVEGVEINAIITIPTKQLITNEIPHSTDSDLEYLKQGKFEYEGFSYLVAKVHPKTLVADIWQMYDFYCFVDKKSSLR